MGQKKARRGEGYTTRINGRKTLTSNILQERLEESQWQYEELLKQNQALREKEAEQLKCLIFYEAWVKGLSSDADAAAAALLPDDSTDSSHLPTTLRLQRRVQKLKQILQPQAQDTQPSAPGPQLPSSAAARQTVIPEAFRSDSNGSAKAAGSDPSSAESQDSNTGGAEGPDEKMAAWFSAVTPEDLNYFRSMTPEDLAVRLRTIIGRLGLAHWATDATSGGSNAAGSNSVSSCVAGSSAARSSAGTANCDSSAACSSTSTANDGSSAAGVLASTDSDREAAVYDVLDEMGKVCALTVMANNAVMCRVYTMNMDTLQVEPWPPQLWPSVAAAMQLSPEQRKTLTEAFKTYNEQLGQLMGQQQGLMQQLQAIMGLAHGYGPQPASAASAVSDVRPAGPKHFMSLATGGAVPGAASAEASTPKASSAATAAAAGVSAAGAVGSDEAAWSAVLDAVGPLSAEEIAMLTDYLQDCKEKAASGAAGLSSSTGSGSGSSSRGSSWLAPPGVLVLQEAEKAEQIMQQLSRIAGLVKQQLHFLTICFVNLLTTPQRAEVVLAAYPYMVDLPELCGCIAEQEGYKFKP